MHSLALSLALFTTASAALKGVAPELVGAHKNVPKAFIYEFADEAESTSFYATLGDNAKIHTKFDSDLFRGVSVQYPSHEEAHTAAARMAQQPTVKAVWPVLHYPRPELDVIPLGNLLPEAQAQSRAFSNDTFGPHVMMQVDKLRARGVTGKGIKVACIDDGFLYLLTFGLHIDYHHPALGGCFGKGCLVSSGYDFVGDAFNGTNAAVPDPDPMGCGSHGTHVSGIIAAQTNEFGFTGVAPGVTLAMYKVFGCEGSTRTDVLISAIMKAVEDGAQIITVSIGAAGAFSEDLWSNLLSKIAREKGIPCTVAAGNDGSLGAFYPSGMANAPDVMSIASFDNMATTAVLTIANFSIARGTSQPFGYVSGKPNKWANVTLPLWALNLNPTVLDDGCSPFPANTPDLSKFVVLLRRGTCTFVQKAKNAAAKGARYIMLYDNVPGTLSIDVTDAKQILASGMVPAKTGESWLKSLSAGRTVTLKMADPSKAKLMLDVVENNTTGGAVSDFSSWGPTMEMNFKPQFGAPGGSILSTLPLSLGGYGVASGTSMSTPMTAGVIALLGEYRRSLNITLIRNLLSANAKPALYNQEGKFLNFLAPAAQQGAGMINAFDAAMATTILEPPSLAFNDTEHMNKNLNFTITNGGKHTVTYEITYRPAGSIYVLAENSIHPSPSPNEVVAASASLDLSAQQTVIKPGASQLIQVNAIPPTGVDERRLLLWSGYIAVNGSDGSSMSLPYEGLAGSLRKAMTLAADGSWIANATDPNLAPVPGNSTFVLPPPGQAGAYDGIPVAVANLTLGSPTVVMSLTYSHSPPSEALSLWEIDGSPLAWSTRGQVGSGFDGQLRNGSYVNTGRYKFVFKALRIAGDALNSGDWDTSETPPFTIMYRK
ncbi:hypothetical protein E4U09_004138 [Claviceps aff. purpurea]|uniref:Subtilisin-like serine protease n=1 Tax=Claviceps aff. purpurea TaxID=1967640 RepID=A0A9P7QP87_9HYPO|nr:hypothetical protein E4U09_004138 [Claviceps aff. purpurea]